MKFSKTQYFFLIVYVVYVAFMVYGLYADHAGYQWDFRVYYTASKCYLQGVNPYDTEVLLSVQPNVAPLPYMYPPLIMYYFLPFAVFGPDTATILYISFKLLCVVALFVAWNRIYSYRNHLVTFLFFSLLAFNAALHRDLIVGNISVFEQLGIAVAILFFLKDRLWLFSLVIILVSSVKMLPIVFLLLLFLSPEPGKYRIFGVSVLIFAAYLSLNFLLEPAYTQSYLQAFSGNLIKEGHITNACSLEFFRTVKEMLLPAAPETLVYSVYLLFVAAVLFFTWKYLGQLKDRTDRDSRLFVIFTFMMAAILILPRFKDYSYIQAILPVFFLLNRLRNRDHFILLIILCCISARRHVIPVFGEALELMWNYYTIILAFVFWIFFLKEGRFEKMKMEN